MADYYKDSAVYRISWNFYISKDKDLANGEKSTENLDICVISFSEKKEKSVIILWSILDPKVNDMKEPLVLI